MLNIKITSKPEATKYRNWSTADGWLYDPFIAEGMDDKGNDYDVVWREILPDLPFVQNSYYDRDNPADIYCYTTSKHIPVDSVNLIW